VNFTRDARGAWPCEPFLNTSLPVWFLPCTSSCTELILGTGSYFQICRSCFGFSCSWYLSSVWDDRGRRPINDKSTVIGLMGSARMMAWRWRRVLWSSASGWSPRGAENQRQGVNGVVLVTTVLNLALIWTPKFSITFVGRHFQTGILRLLHPTIRHAEQATRWGSSPSAQGG